jgi:hypothetical protein
MNKQKKISNKSNQKILLIFIILLAASLVGGFMFGRLMARAEGNVTLVNFACAAKEYFISAIPVVFIIVSVLEMILPLVSFLKCHTMYKKLQDDKENDELWDTLEERLNRPLMLTNAFFMVLVCLFFCCLVIGYRRDYPSSLYFTIYLLFAATSVMEILIVTWIVNMEKKLNPEKQGNVLDVGFQKEWLDSCDEAQKMMVYQAGYVAFLSTNITCLILMVAAFVCAFSFRTNLTALVFVCIIWFVNNMSYMIRATKLEKRK